MKWRSRIADRPRMKTFHNHLHHVHQGRQEMFRGQMVPCFEVPARLDQVLARVRKQALGPVLEAPPRDPQALAAVHSPAYLQFLAGAWAEWVAMDPANAGRDAITVEVSSIQPIPKRLARPFPTAGNGPREPSR